MPGRPYAARINWEFTKALKHIDVFEYRADSALQAYLRQAASSKQLTVCVMPGLPAPVLAWSVSPRSSERGGSA